MPPRRKLTKRQYDILKAAATSGNENRVSELLKSKPELDDQLSGEILWDAVLNDHLEIASMLVEAGANVNATKPKDDDWTHLLHELVCGDDPRKRQLVVLMMQHGANVDAVDCYGFTPIRYAVRAERPVDAIRQLLKHKARVDSRLVVDVVDHPEARELMPLIVGHFVETEDRSHIVRDVLYHCADIGFDREKTAAAAKLLLDMKLPVVKVVMSQTLVAAVRQQNNEMVQLLIELGVDVNFPTPEGSCAIHAACREEDSLVIIELLLRRGADVLARDRRGRTPLSLIESNSEGRIGAAHRVIVRFLALVIFRGEIIDDNDLRIIEEHHETRIYRRECLNELKRMKSMRIMNDLSFYSVLGNFRAVAFLARYPNFFVIYSGIRRSDEFPIYHREMDFALERAKAWKNLLCEREKATCETLNKVLPHVPLERIIFYLYLNHVE